MLLARSIVLDRFIEINIQNELTEVCKSLSIVHIIIPHLQDIFQQLSNCKFAS